MIPDAAVADALREVRRLNDDDATAADAEIAAERLRERWPGVRVDVVWRREEFDERLRFQALIRDEREAILVAHATHEREALPWPLRTLHRWSDEDLLSVDGEVLKVRDAVLLLERTLSDAEVTRTLIDALIVRAELQRRRYDATDAELQDALDDIRRRHGLLTVADTEAWFRERGLSHALLELWATEECAMRRLKLDVARDAGVTDDDGATQSAFDAWLEVRRERADVRWFWGSGSEERATRAVAREP